MLVMVAVTAIAAWPVKSANIADSTLVSTLGVVHDAVGPRAEGAGAVPHRRRPGGLQGQPAAGVRASDTATETMLYRNWLRGVLARPTARRRKKYGRALYDAKSLSAGTRRNDSGTTRTTGTQTIAAKNEQWMKVAEQIKTRGPGGLRVPPGHQRTWTGSAPASSRCSPRSCSRCSTSPRRCWSCSAS